ncbi:(E2-independent) E3 ubiquitin-conjugating enzyme FATS isoform X2 [Scyliorhinus canicula]|uniref:(E2-independent) E3 ubiquitin-conjugating enzyme FATS isoform X2 n=1 Tax=Scyliorhinus canicula TaxID=7830 RepID=UPI0018F65A6E|nr:(E2-independent) E3 ubiquitin-conjugating enzyme FATS isoform X2 [Scyliorhinus canicula]
MELSFQQVPTTHTNEKCEGNYWDFMMSQVKILPSRQFMGNSTLENMPFQDQETQRRVTGDFKKRAAPPASRTASMPELSSEHVVHTPSLNNQNVNDRFGCKEGVKQYYSGTTKCTSNLNYSDISFTAYAQRIQDSSAYRAANIENAFGSSIEKVRIKNATMQKKEYITLVTSDTVKYHQLPKRRIVAVYIVDENQSNNKENEKVNIPFLSVPTKSIKCNRLNTQNEDHVVQGLPEEAGNSAKGYFSLPYFRFREPKSEYTTSCKANAPAPSAVISPAIRGEASKEHSSASSICLQHAQAGHSHQPLSNQNLSLINRLHTAALSTTPAEKSILDSTIHCRKGKTLTKSRRGFSSITITARRIISPSNKLSKRTVSASTNEKNSTAHGRSVKVLKNFKSCKDTMHIHCHTDNVSKFRSDRYTAAGKCSEPRSVLHSTEDRPSSLKIDSRLPETLLLSNNDGKTCLLAQQVQPVVSFSHFKVPVQCFKSTYYLDKSLLVDLCSLTNSSSSGLIQKAALSLKLNCTSSIASADGDNGTVKLISFIGNLKQKVTFTMADKKQLDVSLRKNDFIQGQISTAQKDCTTEYRRNGHAHSGIKDTPSLPERSAHLFIFLSNMNKGTNYDTTEPKYKCQQHKVQSAFSEIIRESADIAFHKNYVELNGKLKDTVREERKRPAFSMIAKSTTGTSTVTQGEDTEISQSELNTVCGKTALQLLTLQEALEMYKPDFISRSQKRLQQLEVKAKQRKAQLVEPMKQPRKRMGAPVQNTPFPSPIKKRQCTVPHPLSDNLFKPRERMIPEKEMQMRSKRIYNLLPEVKRKKEEEKKKIISQTNRLRAELFKKKLLDQILQRNNESVQESHEERLREAPREMS